MNKYDVSGLIGEGKYQIGAYGIVIKAKNRETGEIVAIKKFKGSEEDEIVKKTIIREVKILRMLKHENIVQLKEAFRRKGKLYLVFEYVDQNLLEIIEKNPNGLPPEKIKSFIHQLIRAIGFCHNQSIIHRDIKPENLLISLSNNLKLCDFGFARMVGPRDNLTDYVATRWYRAPELLVGHHYNHSVDMWAIGCMMAELIDAQPLFPGESDIDQIYCIQKSLGPLIPEHQECLSKNKAFTGFRLPKIQNLESIQHRYLGKIESIAIDFILQLIQMDPHKRLTADQALNHPYFQDLSTEKRPHTSTVDRGRSTISTVFAKGKNYVNTPPYTLQKIPEKNSESLPPDKKKPGKYTKSIKKNITSNLDNHGPLNVFRTTSNELYRDVGAYREDKSKRKEKKEYMFKRKDNDKFVDLREKSKTQFSHISSHLTEFMVKMSEA